MCLVLGPWVQSYNVCNNNIPLDQKKLTCEAFPLKLVVFTRVFSVTNHQPRNIGTVSNYL
jgi:hypothetical protein